MRLYYQSFGVSRGSREGHYGQALKRIAEKAASPGTEIAIHGLSPHRAVADQYRYLELLDAVELTEKGLQAEKDGYDAFLIGNIFEPGMHELRELLNIPVLGLRESVLQVACLMGASFSLININPRFIPRVMEGVKLQGFTSRMVSIETMTVARPSVFDQSYTDATAKAEVLKQFTEAARSGIEKGAEVLVPAGGALMAVLNEAGVHEIDGTPVVNGVISLVKVAEFAVQMRQLTGVFTSRRNTYARPSGKLLADIREAYGPQVYPGAK